MDNLPPPPPPPPPPELPADPDPIEIPPSGSGGSGEIVTTAQIRKKIDEAIGTTSEADRWIRFICWVSAIVGLALAPLTLGASLLAMVPIPLMAALGQIASRTKQQVALTRIHLELLASSQDRIQAGE
jgi:hypothetical protein